MNTLLKSLAFAATLASATLATAPANATALVIGDSVSKSVIVNGSNAGLDATGPVGAGDEFADGSIFFDLNAGTGDQLSITVGDGSYCGMYSCAGSMTEIILSSLDFIGGVQLSGFNLISGGPLNAIVTVLDGSSLKISFAEGALSGGTFVLGTYLTGSAVPLPAALPLLVTALGALGFAGRRRKAA